MSSQTVPRVRGRLQSALAIFLASLTVTLWGCGGGSPQASSHAAKTLTSISVTPSNPVVALGDSQQLTATGTFSDGTTQDMTNTVAWTVSPSSVAAVSATGMAHTQATGTATLKATSGSISGNDKLTVSAAVLVSLAVTPSNATVPKGETQQLTATGTYSDGSTQNISSSVTWSASASGVATVNGTGLLSAQAVGSTTITAVSGAINGADTITVGSPVVLSIAVTPAAPSVALGYKQQFKATGTYSDGTIADLTATATWSTAPPTVATVNASGLAASLKVGASGVTATSGSVAGSATLTVTPHVLVSIAVAPASPSLPLGGVMQLDAIGTFSDGTSSDVTQTATWSSAQPSIASAAFGLVSSKATGMTAINAVSGSVIGSAMLTVSAPALYSIAVTPVDPNVAIAGTVQLKAIGSFTNGSTQDLTNSVVWSASPTSVASVSSTGLATGLAPGTAMINADQGTVSAADAIVVSLSSITVVPSTSRLAVGNGLALQAIGKFSNGNTGDVTASVAWGSGTPSVAVINSAGFATALAAGTTTVSASSGTQTGSAAITVLPVVDLNYFANANTAGVSSATVNVSNPGSTGTALCAMFYVFDASEEMNACCGCSVSPDDERTLSVDTDLTGHPLAGAPLTRGIIEIVPADILSNPTCNPTSITPLGSLAAWSSHVQSVSSSSFAATESAFYPSFLGTVNQSDLETTCSFVQSLGSGGGVCTCGTGD